MGGIRISQPGGVLEVHPGRHLQHLLIRDVGFGPGKVIVVGEEKHAMALVPFAHWDAGAIPIPVLGLLFFVVVEATRAQRCPKVDLVFGQSLDDDSWDGLVYTQFGARVLQILVGEGGHGLGGFLEGDRSLFVGDGDRFADGQRDRHTSRGGARGRRRRPAHGIPYYNHGGLEGLPAWDYPCDYYDEQQREQQRAACCRVCR